MEQQSGHLLCRHADDQAGERRHPGYDRQQLDQLRPDRRRSDAARQDTGSGADPGRSEGGFDLDLSNVLPGNTVNLTYTDVATNTRHNVTIVRVDDPAALPLSNTGSAPNSQVIGVNFTGGMASVVSQLNTALGGANLQFSNPSGSTLRVVDSGTGATKVNTASATATASSLANGNTQLPLFTDASSLYTGPITSTGSQLTGYAARITVNAAVLADPSKLTVYNTSPVTT